MAAALTNACAQADSVFSGISTFGRINYSPCLSTDDVKYDIAFLGTCSSRRLLSKLLTDHGSRRCSL